jgi:Zn-dependent protease
MLDTLFLTEGDHLVIQGFDGSIILKWALEKYLVRYLKMDVRGGAKSLISLSFLMEMVL